MLARAPGWLVGRCDYKGHHDVGLGSDGMGLYPDCGGGHTNKLCM
jgi:hypothetical protein